ncbi:MAG: thioredoxin fold domain-containing protein [Balneolales bacterium]
MKFYYNLCFISTLLLTLGCIQNENKYNGVWHSLEDAQKKVTHDNNKKLLLSVYTEDDNESKQLQEEVLPDPAVTKMMNKHFCSVQINANSKDSVLFNGVKKTEKEIAEDLGVTSYPTIVFLNSDGEKIIITNGFMDAKSFTNLLSYVGSDAYLTTEFDLYLNE